MLQALESHVFGIPLSCFFFCHFCTAPRLHVTKCLKKGYKPLRVHKIVSELLKFHSACFFYSVGVEPAARRGLAFADPHNASLASAENSNTFTSNSAVTYPESVHALPPNTLQFGYRKSAFQPVQVRPHQDQLTINNYAPPQRSRLLDSSSCNDAENVFCKPVHEVKPPVILHAEATQFNDSVFTRVPNNGNPVTTDKLKMTFRTPDANRSGDFNNSNLTGPSPTLFTKQALMVVGDMFSGPLDSERDLTLGGAQQPMDQMDKDFEAAFSNDDCTSVNPFSTGFGAMGRFRISNPNCL